MINNKIFLALGSNLGDTKENFIIAINKLQENGVKFIKSSPLYNTPALLLPSSPISWDIPYLNCIIEVETKLEPLDLLKVCKKVEMELGRDFSKKWAPRPIDIDILLYKNIKIDSDILTIPHKAIFDRYFLLDEFSFLDNKIIEGKNYYSKEHQPVFMGIMNITQNSFSTNDIYLNNIDNFIKDFEDLEENNVGIIDIGAEATNPNATAISDDEEIVRLNDIFKYIKNKKFNYFRSMLSIDTYHYKTAKIAIENGFDILNDVNALKDERMLDLIVNNNIKYVLTHSLTVPSDKNITVDENIDIIDYLQKWLKSKLKIMESKKIDLEKIIFDPGLGFGKNYFQNMNILENIDKFHKYSVKILIGHSRKSFIKKFYKNSKENYDFESMGITLKIADKVDIIRTHRPIESQNAMLFYKNV